MCSVSRVVSGGLRFGCFVRIAVVRNWQTTLSVLCGELQLVFCQTCRRGKIRKGKHMYCSTNYAACCVYMCVLGMRLAGCVLAVG